jgi:hypothetical protein
VVQIPLAVTGTLVKLWPLVGVVIVAAVVGGGEVMVPEIPKPLDWDRVVASASTGIKLVTINKTVASGNNSFKQICFLNITFLY